MALCSGLLSCAGTQSWFTGVRDSEWQWHQLGHKQICTLTQTDNHASIPPLSVFPILLHRLTQVVLEKRPLNGCNSSSKLKLQIRDSSIQNPRFQTTVSIYMRIQQKNDGTYEQWFSNERISGKSVALNAVSAIASNTSYSSSSSSLIHSLFISLKSTMTKRTAVTIEIRLVKCKVNSHIVIKIQ